MLRFMVAMIMTALLSGPAFSAGEKPEAGSAGKPVVHDDKAKDDIHFDIKKAAQVQPDKENLEKNKDVVKAYNDYWKAIVAKNYKKAYGLESADYKKKVSYDAYVNKFKESEKAKDRIIIKFVQPIEVKQQNEKEVIVRGFLRYKLNAINSIKTFDDRWSKNGDVYSHLQGEEKKEVVK